MEKAQLAISRALQEIDLEEVVLNAQVELLRHRQDRAMDVPVIGWRRSPRYKDGLPVVDLTLEFRSM